MTWTSANASSVWLHDFGSVSANGSQQVNNLMVNRTYNMTVYGQGNTSAQCSVTVYVQAQIYPQPPVYIPGAPPGLDPHGIYVPPTVITSGSTQNPIYIPGQAPGLNSNGQGSTFNSGGGPGLDNGSGFIPLPAGGVSHTPVY